MLLHFEGLLGYFAVTIDEMARCNYNLSPTTFSVFIAKPSYMKIITVTKLYLLTITDQFLLIVNNKFTNNLNLVPKERARFYDSIFKQTYSC